MKAKASSGMAANNNGGESVAKRIGVVMKMKRGENNESETISSKISAAAAKWRESG